MFKKIPGSLDYLINLKQQIIDHYGCIVEFERVSRDYILIELFGEKKKVDLNWLALLAWYECGYINNLHEHLDKIKFQPVNSRNLSIGCGYLMTFSEPIYYKNGFRYIPNYPRYAIDIHNNVIDTFTNKIITDRSTEASGYEMIYIRSPDKCMNRTIRIHRLLGLAWIPNSDFNLRPLINHIDGIKSNNKLENLEWCSESENSLHAHMTGLNTSSVKMKSRDVITGEVVIYRSAAEMANKLGMSNVAASGYVNKMPGYLYKKRYEIKLFDDITPWFFEENEFSLDRHGKSIYTITTFNKKTGESKTFQTTKAFRKEYKLWTRSYRLEDEIAMFKEKYPDFDVSYKKNAVSGPYRVLDIETNQIVIFGTIWEAGEYIGRSRTELQYDLVRKRKFIYSGKWIVASGLNEIVLAEYKDKPKPFNRVLIVNVSDNSETIADSINHAAKISGLQDRTINKYLKTGKEIKGYIFRPLK